MRPPAYNEQTGTPSSKAGYSLVEVMVSSFIVFMTLTGAILLFLAYRNAFVITTLARNTTSEASYGLERMVYGLGTNAGLREAAFSTVSVSFPAGGWQLNYNTNRFYRFNPGAENIVDENGSLVCEGVSDSTVSVTNKGVAISLNVHESGGGHLATNAMSSFVQFRNLN